MAPLLSPPNFRERGIVGVPDDWGDGRELDVVVVITSGDARSRGGAVTAVVVSFQHIVESSPIPELSSFSSDS